MLPTAFLYDPLFLEHNTGRRHPENSRRLTAILERLQESGVLRQTLQLKPREAPLAAITRIHDAGYVEEVADCCRSGRLFHADSDTVGSSATYPAAVLAAGAVLTAIDAVMEQKAANAFCAVRPPGHHAERDQALGFCFFNNVAIGARYLQDRYEIAKVAIMDWDVHHGNGTQHAFYADPSVFYFSIHQYPLYPGSGRRNEQGEGPGKTTTLNVPVPAGATDTDYLRAFREELRPAMDRFQPDFVLISAGFDAHRDDPLAAIQVTEEGFGKLTAEVLGIAQAYSQGRVVSVLEGGYNLEALAASVELHLQALMGQDVG